MSTDTPNMAVQQTTADAASEIEAFFNGVEARAQQRPRFQRETGMCQFNVTGVGSWLFSIKDGLPTLVRGSIRATPDATFTCSPDVLLRILHREGNLNAMAATLQGLVVVGGDPALVAQVLERA